MSEIETPTISLHCRIKSSAVTEDKKKEDGFVVTKFEGLGMPGLFYNYSKDLEQVVFTNHCWEGLKTGEQVGEWFMKVTDDTSENTLANLKKCVIKDIAFKVGENNVVTVGISIQHIQTSFQPAIESVVGKSVWLHLTKDMSILPGISEEEEEDMENDLENVEFDSQ